jgi:hypothetical protein
MKNKPVQFCPVCGLDGDHYYSPEFEDGAIVQVAHCSFCDTHWHDWYKIISNVIDEIGPNVPKVIIKKARTATEPGPYQAWIDRKIEGVGDTREDAKRDAVHSFLERLEEERWAKACGELPQPPEPTGLLLNKYKCRHCSHFWADVYDNMVDMECPQCGTKDISPYTSEEVTQ